MGRFFTFKIIGLSAVLGIVSHRNLAQSISFAYTGAPQTYVVPDSVTSITVDAQGAMGGSTNFSRGGYGGRVQCRLTVTPGSVLTVFIGGAGLGSKGSGVTGGFNGGGAGEGNAGGGGGATDIRIGGVALSNRVVVAGGGGGGATNTPNRDYDRGGNGGGLTGENGYSYAKNTDIQGGFSGSASDWSAFPDYTVFKNGTLGIGGNGYDDDGNSGGGGGGYYGGCGGGAYTGSGGGGGSSYTDAFVVSSVTHTRGYNKAGNGMILITPVKPVVAAPAKAPVEVIAVPDLKPDAGDPSTIKILDYSGATQAYRVPKNVTSLGIDLQGAVGGSTGFSRGGHGGRVQCKLAVTPGSIVYVYLGGAGGNSNGLPGTGGYNGGGAGEEYGGGGGGGSDIRLGGYALSNRVVIAGGGGGGSANSANINYDRGGDGGGLVAEAGYSSASNTNGKGGSGGGSLKNGAGTSSTHANGGDGNVMGMIANVAEYSGGGGGGGYYMGGGGSCGGGGGSSYTDPVLATSVIHTRGYNTAGNGKLIITPFVPIDNSDEEKEGITFNPHNGKIWGQVFSDYAYKAHADTILEGRSGISQYAKVPAGVSMFQFRRIALGYNYDISKKFSAEFVLAAEDDYTPPLYQSGGDLLINNKFAPFIKIANLRWKNIIKGGDVVIGQLYTPAFHSTSEEAWGYRSVARTLTDVYRTNEYDMGVSLQGHLLKNDRMGYSVMIGNGTGAKPETNAYKWFYGDVNYKLFDKKVIVDFYADYQKLTWTPSWHRDRQMNKVFVAYTVPKITVGVEVFMNRLMGDNIATKKDGVTTDTITTHRTAFSIFVHGPLYKNKLGYFARYDDYSWSSDNNNNIFQAYNDQTQIYDHNTTQMFVTFGLDYTPYKNVHIMPNIWYNYYENVSPSSYGNGNKDFDLVYRLTISYQFGK